MKIKPFRIITNVKQRKRIQEIIFKSGYSWCDGDTEITINRSKYLYFGNYFGGKIPTLYRGDNKEVFNSDYLPELTYSEFIEKYDK